MSVRGNPERIFCEGVKWGSLDSASFDEVVGYFKKRVEYGFFRPVKELLLPEYKRTGFLILVILSALIDALSQYYYCEPNVKHKDKYKMFLRDNFAEFRESISLKKFPHAKDFADFFYDGFRCQILHNFMLSEHSTIGWKTGLVYLNIWDERNDLKEIIVNPRLLTERLENMFNDFINDLLNPKNSKLRSAFANKLFIDTGVKIKP